MILIFFAWFLFIPVCNILYDNFIYICFRKEQIY